jgi:hypothetical protein
VDRFVVDDDPVEIENHSAKHTSTITEIFFYFN